MGASRKLKDESKEPYLTVLLLFTDSGYPFGIFKLFFLLHKTHYFYYLLTVKHALLNIHMQSNIEDG
jgi:hypothetical protein